MKKRWISRRIKDLIFLQTKGESSSNAWWMVRCHPRCHSSTSLQGCNGRQKLQDSQKCHGKKNKQKSGFRWCRFFQSAILTTPRKSPRFRRRSNCTCGTGQQEGSQQGGLHTFTHGLGSGSPQMGWWKIPYRCGKTIWGSPFEWSAGSSTSMIDVYRRVSTNHYQPLLTIISHYYPLLTTGHKFGPLASYQRF